MTEPTSMKNEPFTDFPRQAYSFVTDDFCHDKSFVAKVTAKTGKSVIKLKEAVSYKKESWSVADEIKLWLDLPNNKSLYAKIKSNDYIKLNYDHGLRLWNQKAYNLFAGVNCNKGIRNIVLKAGVGHYSEHCNSENRIRVGLQKDENLWQWASRTTFRHNKLTFGVVSVFNITDRVLQKNNLLFGYNFDVNTDVFLRAQTAGFRKVNFDIQRLETIFDTFTLDIVRKINANNKAAVEAVFDIKNKEFSNIVLAYQSNYRPKESIKASVNSNLDIAVVHKRPIVGLQSLGTLSIGAQVSGLQGKNISFKQGIEIALNL